MSKTIAQTSNLILNELYDRGSNSEIRTGPSFPVKCVSHGCGKRRETGSLGDGTFLIDAVPNELDPTGMIRYFELGEKTFSSPSPASCCVNSIYFAQHALKMASPSYHEFFHIKYSFACTKFAAKSLLQRFSPLFFIPVFSCRKYIFMADDHKIKCLCFENSTTKKTNNLLRHIKFFQHFASLQLSSCAINDMHFLSCSPALKC